MIRACSAVGAVFVMLVLMTSPARAQTDPAPDPLPTGADPSFVRMTVSEVAPRTVSSSTTAVTVAGTVRNVGDRDVRDLELRLQRAPTLDTGGDIRAALRTTTDDLAAAGPFEPVTDVLTPGESIDFRVSVPVSGPGSLELTRPGVYPALVNLNGEPDFGTTARLDAAPFLLPVMPTEPRTAPPTITMLWPLADRPHLLPVEVGADPVLDDDDLAGSFAPGGRLDGLLGAIESVTQEDRTGVCLAVDPDLLVTAETMAGADGYSVRTGSSETVAGAGGGAAAAWLERLRALVRSTCVVATPWAQADVNAAARAGLAAEQRVAVVQGAAELERILGLNTVPDLTWPAGGLLSDAAATQLIDLDRTTVVLDADAVASPSAGTVRTADGALGALLADPPTSTALAGPGGPLGIQNAIGALSWPAVTPDAAPRSLLIAPPPTWNVNRADAEALLEAGAGLVSAGLAERRSLVSMVSESEETDATAALAYPPTAAATGVPASVTDEVAVLDRRLTSFTEATSTDVQSRVDPASIVGPLRESLVRILTTGPASGDTAATDPHTTAAVVGTLLSGISLQNPGGVYTLASEESPLLLVVRNDLPLQAGVRIKVTGPPGLTVGDVGVQQLPARSARQLVLPTSISRTGQFAVTVTLTTSTGTALGEPAQIVVRSRAYGTATAAVTGGAAAVLVLLVVRRLWHRFRGRPDRADEGRIPL